MKIKPDTIVRSVLLEKKDTGFRLLKDYPQGFSAQVFFHILRLERSVIGELELLDDVIFHLIDCEFKFGRLYKRRITTTDTHLEENGYFFEDKDYSFKVIIVEQPREIE